MIILVLVAFASGIATVLSPCILPVLPVVLSGSVGGGKARPLGIISGFIISFTLFTLTLSAIVSALGISADILRWIAAGLIFLFGLIMVIPPLKNAFMSLASKLTAGGTQGSKKGTGYFSGVALGLSLGLVWTPCVGPIMASVISLALSSTINFGSVAITIAYASGTALPLLAIMMGGRKLLEKFKFLTKNTGKIYKVFGVLMLLTAIALFTGLDRQFQTFVLQLFPQYGAGLTSFEDQDIIRKELDSIQRLNVDDIPSLSYDTIEKGGTWINSTPINPASLKGKVVLIDFWTYSCINCIRTLPYLKAWDEAYRDEGLVIIGVHSPEFAFEKEETNVRNAVNDFNIKYPVVLDNNFAIWKSFYNKYWPAHYLFNKEGKLVDVHFGEGKYKETESKIQMLLHESSSSLTSNQLILTSNSIVSTEAETKQRTPETYVGWARAENFVSVVKETDGIKVYSVPSTLEKNQWAISGKWTINEENIRADGPGTLEIRFYAKDVYLVLGPADGFAADITVTVDDVPVNTVDIKNGRLVLTTYRLYDMFRGKMAINGLLRLKTSGPIEVFAFTFG